MQPRRYKFMSARAWWSTTIALLCLLAWGATLGQESQDSDKWRQFDGTRIRVLSSNFTFLEGIEKCLPEFQELTGIDVRIDQLNAENALQRIRTELASGSGAYDIIWSHANWVIPYAESGWLQSLDELIADDSITLESVLALDDFLQSTLNLMEYEDQLYGLPWFAATVITYYRSDILAEHGIDPAQLDTIEGFYEAAKAVHSNDIAGVVLRGAPSNATWLWTIFFKGLGGQYVADLEGGDLTPVLDSAAAIEATRMYADMLANYSIPGAANTEFDEIVIAMQQGRAVLAIEGAPLAGRILDPEQSRVVGDLGFRVVPEGPGGRHPAFTGHGFSIPASARNKGAAWLFMQWAMSTEGQKCAALNANHIAVTRSSVWNDPEFRENWNLPGEGDFLATFEASLDAGHPEYRPRVQGWAEVDQAIGRAINRAITGTQSPEEAMRRAQEEATEILRRLRLID